MGVYSGISQDNVRINSGNATLQTLAVTGSVVAAGVVMNVRQRFTIAEVNAGATLVAAVAGKSIRMVSCKAIAVGGAAGAVTTVDVLGTLSTGRKLVAFAQANLTQSTVLTDGGTGAAVLADGASYTANDAGTRLQRTST